MASLDPIGIGTSTVWYLGGRNAAVGNAVVVAAGQAVLFILCLFYISIAIVLRLELTAALATCKSTDALNRILCR
jgi:hypothetical protein